MNYNPTNYKSGIDDAGYNSRLFTDSSAYAGKNGNESRDFTWNESHIPQSVLDDPEARQLLDNNPYSGYGSYTGSFFQELSGKAEKYRQEMYVKYREYIAQVIQWKQQKDYNSEQAKAARMRNAGMNPDLMGIDSASSLDSTPGVLGGPELESADMENLSLFLEVGLSTMNTAIAMAQGFKSLALSDSQLAINAKQLEILQTDQDARAVGLDSSAYIQALNVLSSVNPSDSRDRHFVSANDISEFGYYTPSPDNDGSEVWSPASISSNVNNAISALYGSNAHKAAYNKLNAASTGDEVSGIKFRSFIDQYNDNESKLHVFVDKAISSEYERVSASNSSSIKEAEYNEARLGLLDPITSASAENAKNILSAQNSEYETEVSSMYKSIFNDLYSKHLAGDMESTFMCYLWLIANKALGFFTK
nr:MAG: DNA pilot protein [Microvirus sp.]